MGINMLFYFKFQSKYFEKIKEASYKALEASEYFSILVMN